MLQVWEYSAENSPNGQPKPAKFKGNLYEVAGVKVPRPFHDFRKTVKLELKRKSVDAKKTREYQGHKTESKDDYYTFFQRKDMEDLVSDGYEEN